MKYGLVYYKYTDNLGDDILSYAAKQFLPNIDYYIDRESMDIFVPNEDEAVAVILNGWFLHIFQSFPPSPFIKPLFIGTHFRKDENLFHDYSYLESKTAKNFLKKYEPIGCRDRNTNEVLNKIGIQSYFSGCLTLTLKPFSDIENNHKIILTDVPKEIETYVKGLLPEKDIITQTHLIPDEKRGASWQSREQCLEEHLKLYQGADLVITTRLHCALPSIALGTKTILISKYDEDWKKRISDFAEYCTMFSAQDILDKKADRLLLFPELIENEGNKRPRSKLRGIERGRPTTYSRICYTAFPPVLFYIVSYTHFLFLDFLHSFLLFLHFHALPPSLHNIHPSKILLPIISFLPGDIFLILRVLLYSL